MVAGRTFVISIIAGVVLIGGLVAVYLLWRGEESPETVEPVSEVYRPMRPTPTPQVEEVSPLLTGVTLAESDEVVRELARRLSSHPKLMVWLANEDLIRRVTASVDTIANGKSPRSNLEFLAPKEKLTVIKKRGDYVIDPASYERYNLLAGVIASLDAEAVVATYRELRPLIDEAYQEIAQPGTQFEMTLQQAINELLAVPIVEEDIYVKEKVITYTMIDEKLEGLSLAQRHLLRMGPVNVRLVQEKLQEIRALLSSSDGTQQ